MTATFWLLKSLHILALALGLGGGVANAIAARLARSRPEAAPAFGARQKRIGMVSVGALVVLWITVRFIGPAAGWWTLADMPCPSARIEPEMTLRQAATAQSAVTNKDHES